MGGLNSRRTKSGNAPEELNDDELVSDELCGWRTQVLIDAIGAQASYHSKFRSFCKFAGAPFNALPKDFDPNDPEATFPEVGYNHLLRYVYGSRGKHAPPTQAQTVSVMIHFAHAHGQPIGENEAKDIHQLINALNATAEQRRPRGAIDRELFGHLVKEALERDLPDMHAALIVQFGISCRGPSVLPFLTVADVNFGAKTVNVARKATKIEKGKHGEKITVPIVTVECYERLKAMSKGRAADALLFPTWDAERSNTFIREVAAKYKWATDFQWTNHSLRHGSAMEYTEELLDKLRARGGWKCSKTALFYARLRDQRFRDGLPDLADEPNSLFDAQGLPIEDLPDRARSELDENAAAPPTAAGTADELEEPPLQRARSEGSEDPRIAAFQAMLAAVNSS